MAKRVYCRAITIGIFLCVHLCTTAMEGAHARHPTLTTFQNCLYWKVHGSTRPSRFHTANLAKDPYVRIFHHYLLVLGPETASTGQWHSFAKTAFLNDFSEMTQTRMLCIKSMWSIHMFAVTGHVKFFRKSKMAAKPRDLHSAIT